MVGVCDVPVISGVCDTAGDAAASLVTAPFDWLANAMGEAAQWMFESVWSILDTTTMVDITGSEYTRVYNILFGVAVFVMLGFFMLQVIGGMVRREPAALSRAVVGLAKSVLGSFVALALLTMALEVTDQLCLGIVHAAGTNMEEMGDRIALLAAGLTSLTIAAPGAGAIITIFVAGLAIGAAFLVWMSLLVRKALLLIAIVFAPIALAGSTWDHTRQWASRWATFVIALIISKVVVVVIFLIATAQVAAPIDSDLKSVSEPISGVVLMLIAGFAPYMAYKAISFMGFDMYHAMSAEQEAKNSLNRPMPIPLSRRPGIEPPKVLSGGAEGGSGAGADGSSAAPPAASPGAGGSTAMGGGGIATGWSRPAVGLGTAAVGAGLVVANKAATAGPQLGTFVGGAVADQSDAAHDSQPPPSTPMTPHAADPTLTGGRTEGR